MAGSKTDMPKELIAQIRHLESLFTVDTKKLKEITDHFISELDKGKHAPTGFREVTLLIAEIGLSVEGGSIV